ncbi:MAG: nucleotidyltransferase [Methylotenera sp.]|nr:nucleotidyltransferase [Methylotenera sp.]MDP2101571.1 nucleotidyltransferase [Methylotenera sp.]MDP2404275.1 nucleotidyltransferase [Methylotenera sp.]MDP3095938.1 nucleotidyltransferase [Methylotenera sp.]MDZ4223622.1 nucleotidyltransferase [Methylotenera sp.]
MTTSEMFQGLLNSLKIDNADQISLRYEEITSCLNKTFRDTDSKTANSLQVGSYGRWTAIKGISDLDMLYIMPATKWSDYKDGKQYKLLSDTKDAISARYPKTEVYVDRLVVCVLYKNFHVEVQPVFEQDDGSFIYPDTYNGGSWKVTKPCEEIKAMKEFVDQKNKNLRQLCKMARAWKNKHGVGMGGLLIDTLAHNFLKSTNEYDDKSFTYYDWMSRDFFKYLMEQPNQDHYKALGSGQNVRVRNKFQKKAKKAYDLCLKAIEDGDSDTANEKWKKVFGRPFPASTSAQKAAFAEAAHYWRNTEEFIEDKYPIDIRYNLEIDCDVSQNGFREHPLRYLLSRAMPLLINKSLAFKVVEIDVPQPFEIKWKVLNRGDLATQKDMIRGQILDDGGNMQRVEQTSFKGEHIVECFAIKNGIVVAKDRIDVPIQER